MQRWRYKACWRLRPVWGTSGDLYQWPVGDGVWWWLELQWCHCCVQPTWIPLCGYSLTVHNFWCHDCNWASLPHLLGAIAYSNAYFGEGSGPIYMDNVACSGTESSLYLCSSLPLGSHNCGHYEDAGVGCPGTNLFHVNHTMQILHGFKLRQWIIFHWKNKSRSISIKDMAVVLSETSILI